MTNEINQKDIDWIKKNLNSEKVKELIDPILHVFEDAGKDTGSEGTQLVVLTSIIGLILKQSNIPEKEKKALLNGLERIKY